jgi:isoleucyl-tRNA synthetase
MNIEAGFGMVITMDGNISDELKIEGYARDVVRQIQEARKEADYQVDDRISVSIKSENEDVQKVVETFGEYITKETLSTLDQNLSDGEINKTVEFEGLSVQLILKK